MAPAVTSTTKPAATKVPHYPQPGGYPSPSQRGAVLTPSVTVAPKRTAAGRYKKRLMVYTEGGDSDNGSDCTSDSEGTFPKRLRRGTITRNSLEPTEDIGDSSNSLPPDDLTLLQSPTPSSRRSAGPSDDADPSPSCLQGPDRSSPSTDKETSSCNTPSTTALTTEGAPLSDASPTGFRDTGVTGITTVGDVSPRIDSHPPPAAVVPKFLTVTPKKSKASIHSYLVRCKDSHFQNLLKLYIAFENVAAASEQAGSLSTTCRPSQVGWWIRSARFGTLPSLPNLHNYSSSVISWWSHLQPSWRKLDYAHSNRDDGAFGCLVQPGINGLLNIVILAYWWSSGLAKSEDEGGAEGQRYRWFVADVSWVFSRLVETVLKN